MFRILIIEDEELLLWAMEQHLSQEGYFTFSANTGEKAQQILREESVDLVVSDLLLPDLSGTTMAEEVRRLHPNLPMVAITASSIAEERIRLIIPLANAVLWKPFKLEELSETIQEVLAVQAPQVDFSTEVDRPGEMQVEH
jgi:two-component system cell cycle sensor histidine kinase/response regulator CckA